MASTAELQPLHLPPEPSWWPPAPGYWLLLIVLLLLLAGYLYWQYRRNAWRRIALQELARIEQLPCGSPQERLLQLQSSAHLMRRLALRVCTPSHVTSLIADDWLYALDEIGQTNAFSEGHGRVLSSAPYMPVEHVPDDLVPLHALLKRTIIKAKAVPRAQAAS